MPELRLNLITREWVIIATERAKRPNEFRQKRDKKYLPDHDKNCPFCPGNEDKTPGEIMKVSSDGSWKIRVTPNKFSALSFEGERKRINEGLKHLVTGVGRHEVIIESALHNTPTALMPVADAADILRIYKNRFLDIYNDPRIEHVIIFKNNGEKAGTSIEHAHSQIVGTPVTPMQVRDRIDETTRYFNNTGGCLMCATVRSELSEGRRIILDTNHFVTFIPYAALSPFHTWIFPKKHSASFGDISDEEIADLAYNLKTALSKIYHGLDNPDYNYVIRSESPKESGSEYFHWYLSIVPRVIQAAGFELGSGMYINTSLPEEIAEFLRKVKTDS
ncbi:MAG: galactose-1-phosphate uridylyltransferase [Nitrospirae bacterium GWF2_44_13]|nr:MAG: galactose-1-phosphate uridylyltransferase [Nitrospirae bacterium GWF2_44_13]OGW35325.1 MAG: galactose-1-phosphate uridylyltransferase [Nitrospirae bacterium GWD2_44_7]OGW63789.1 MAG: galactose-1-phosphate uridylyltransferase [Nitrospirae bacterium RIFOXYA2_FULL_44_9]HBG92014.1 galactose-1-phosphate uridylyltransferase [Nitrospiraceae bacterium]